ncbi:carboxypeptidase-like regulatory domain-containing protein [Flavobacterium sp. J27]|uniref:carboxypeptidase-like regulatory domain-containing protein n=1 Tax=Flavobacterium sp. J27 TaxID=2060419 RepID=UPI001031E333|nr:carboxypeptidase-like regulatory domain-containing protein [Flavobacterium sp. J27]
MQGYFKILFFLLFFSFSLAQTTTISGKIVDEDNFPIESAALVIYDTSHSIVNYTVTLSDGSYSFEVLMKKEYVLEIAHIAFNKLKYVFNEQDYQKKGLLLNFTLESNTAALDEVILVSSAKVQDTVKLDLDRLNLKENDNLKNILDKIPNFKVSDDGNIIYKGKNIDKILVNNKATFENQNSIALESIEKKMIDGISVINNYSDDFSLDFDDHQESVLNIDTSDKSQYIFNGSVEGNYGYDNKYEIKAKEFLFSNQLNAFLTHHTNNIGKTTIQSQEIKKLFNQGQPFSKYQAESLGRLFVSNENLKKDFFTTTNLTLRSQTNRLKTFGLFYYIAPDRVNSILQNTSTINKEPLLNTSNLSNSKSQSFLGTLFLAYKFNPTTIGTYKVNANFIDNRNTSEIENQIFENGSINQTNVTFSNNKNKIASFFNDFGLKSKIKEDLIFESNVAFFNEKTKLLNDYNINTGSTLLSNLQDYEYQKNNLQTNLGLRYKVSNAFIPSLTFEYNHTQEQIEDRMTTSHLIDRSIEDFTSTLQIKGNDVFKRLDYEFSLGVNPFYTKVNETIRNKETFLPVTVTLDYESPLHRYNLTYSRYKSWNQLESGITTVQPFNAVWNGDFAFPLGFSTSNTLKIGYNYDNFFDAKLFSIDLSYSNQNDILKKNFLQQQNGIATYTLFIAEEASNFEIVSFYSKTVSQLKYPTKIDLGAKYKIDKYPIIINQEQVNSTSTTFSPELKLETITGHLINFSLLSKMSFITNRVTTNKYKATYRQNGFSILMKNEQWKANVHFLYDYNTINSIDYSRKNINVDFSYTAKKFTYSIEARHLGELLHIFENESYNSQFVLKEGIANTIINNQSLNYIILGIKYKL